MNAEQKTLARTCLASAYDKSMSFPQIVGALIAGGFEGYSVDYRRNIATYYLQDGDSVTFDQPPSATLVAAAFDQPAVQAAIREAQQDDPGYSYDGFNKKVKAAGCAGYIVSFLGKRVVYFGRTAETHVELFPQ